MRRRSLSQVVALAGIFLLGACGGGTPAPASAGPTDSEAPVATVGPQASSPAPASTGVPNPSMSASPPPVSATGHATGVAAGDHTCALLDSGVACWGPTSAAELNSSGQLNGSLSPVTVAGLTDATSVAVGRGYACAVRSGGSVGCWGNNNSGAFGTGQADVGSSATPVAVPGVTSATAVAADAHACALLANGGVMCWGTNVWGQLGNGTKAQDSLPVAPVAVSGLTDAVSIAVGGNASCAVRSGGGVVCWGSLSGDAYGAAPVAISGITDATAVVVGDRYACALRTGGGVACWGDNSSGQLGVGVSQLYGGTSPGTSAEALPVVGVEDAVAISAFYLHTCVLRSDGSVACWGRNDSGMNGDGTTQPSWTPVAAAGVRDAVGVAAGVAHACAVLSGGGVVCWGSGYGGILGDGTGRDSLVPVAVPGI